MLPQSSLCNCNWKRTFRPSARIQSASDWGSSQALGGRKEDGAEAVDLPLAHDIARPFVIAARSDDDLDFVAGPQAIQVGPQITLDLAGIRGLEVHDARYARIDLGHVECPRRFPATRRSPHRTRPLSSGRQSFCDSGSPPVTQTCLAGYLATSASTDSMLAASPPVKL